MADIIFTYKETEQNGDIIQIRILQVELSDNNKEGRSYSLVFIRDGKRLVGYDNFEGHGPQLRHHRHVRDHITPYAYIDEWKLISDFMEDIDKIKRGTIQ